MKVYLSIVTLFLSISTLGANAQAEELVTEARDVAAAFMGAANFAVTQIGEECLSLLERLETPKEYVSAWQERNAKYYAASTKYMAQRTETSFASGGTSARDAMLNEYSTVVRKEGEGAIAEWFEKRSKQDGCQHAVSLIDNGILDVDTESPLYHELEGLVVWANEH
jgi:hypothetical protein